jgi:uncharacterized lipoprotein YddW (UPF0748 family)
MMKSGWRRAVMAGAILAMSLVCPPSEGMAEGTFAGKRAMFDEDPFWTNKAVADRTLQRIKDAGFNVYVPNVWHGRGTTWSSTLAPWDFWLRDLSKTGVDPLKYLIEKAHSMGIEVHPWFNIVLRQSDIRPEFALPGKTSSGDGAFDVHNEQFRHWIASLVAEVAARYDVDGINVDHVRAIMLCTTATCINEYRQKYGRTLQVDGVVLAMRPSQVPTLVQYQEQAVTETVKAVSDAVHAVKPHLLISADAIPDLAGAEQGQNSIAWLNQRIVDVVLRMDYYRNIDVKLTDSIRQRLTNPDGLSVLISNISNYEEMRPGQAHFARDGAWVANTVSLVHAHWPRTGIGVYFYKMLSDEQIAALKQVFSAER